MKGTGAHLLKAGSKRRRKQAQIAGQDGPEELSAVVELEQSQRIAELEHQLAASQQEVASNKAAADILTEMIQTGDAEQDMDGVVRVSKRRPELPNIIGTLGEL